MSGRTNQEQTIYNNGSKITDEGTERGLRSLRAFVTKRL